MMKKSSLLVVLAVLTGCVASQKANRSDIPAGPVTQALTNLLIDLAEEGLIVTAEGLLLPWEERVVKNARHVEIYLAIKETGTEMNLSFYAADPTEAISETCAYLLLNDLAVSQVDSMGVKGNTDLRVTFSGQSKELGRVNGQVRAWIVPGTKKTAMLFAYWLEKLDGQASADFDAIVHGVKAAEKK